MEEPLRADRFGAIRPGSHPPMAIAPSAARPANGRLRPDDTLARVTLRPIGSPLPLGAFALVPSGLLLAGLQLGWFRPTDAKTIAFVVLGFAVPLQLVSSILAFLARDPLVGTGFGMFTGIWLAFGLSEVSGTVSQTSNVLGVFFLSCGAVFALLMAGGLAGGKAAAGLVILAGSARFILSGLYELIATKGLEHAAGIVGLVFVGVAGYVGLASLVEDSAHRSILPLGRRQRAKAAIQEGLESQLSELEHEAGVREQL
jgi:succinate-acetate transporter protein